jgi:hypothetical protein
MAWPKERFPALLLLAAQYSDDPVFREEYERLLPLTAEPSCSRLLDKKMGRIPLDAYEKRERAYVLYQIADAFTMQSMQNRILLRLDPDNQLARAWIDGIGMLWDEASLAVADDGKLYFRVLVDIETGKSRPVTEDCPYPCKGAKMGWTPMITRAALESRQYLPDFDPDWCRRILSRLALEDLSYFEGPDNFTPAQKFKTRFLSGDAIVNYIWSLELLWGNSSCETQHHGIHA